jgi:hypothetical protein
MYVFITYLIQSDKFGALASNLNNSDKIVVEKGI